jgi:hypothetical protein
MQLQILWFLRKDLETYVGQKTRSTKGVGKTGNVDAED